MAIRFELPAVLTIYNVTETRDALLSWLARESSTAAESIEIGGQDVAEIDGAGAQLLGSLAQSLTDTGVPWKLSQPSQSILDACARMGIDKWLDGECQAGAKP